jgi:hypothetical protein
MFPPADAMMTTVCSATWEFLIARFPVVDRLIQ